MFDNNLKTVPAIYNAVQESNRERLEREKNELLSRIKDIDRALAIFTAHPEMEEITDLLRRL